QTSQQFLHGTVERIKVHGRSLEGNLEGDSPDRDVAVYLPPGYGIDTSRRYPVVYLLHGYTNDTDHWFGFQPSFVNVRDAADRALSGGTAKEMILVMPNGYTVYQGNYYTNSVTTGDWETYITEELVSSIDSHYRTIAAPASRGLAGHSSGGYGTIRLAMKHPGIFSSIYVLSPCCMTASLNPGSLAESEAIHNMEEFAKAGFGPKSNLALAASLSPNPKNPPYYFDLPTKDGQVLPDIAAKWAASAPLAMIDQYIRNIRKLHAIAFDAGSKDEPIATTVRTLDQVLTQYNIPHGFEIYDGDHRNRITERMEKKALPFFSTNLSFDRGGH
ncbi:MAG TPA: alpha/beta hydrolase-fold protein, partial [Candidatus Binatia bacterium]|nr:alpha/beta hydrolase-fold protein [Candidatus Binatia bacterium]